MEEQKRYFKHTLVILALILGAVFVSSYGSQDQIYWELSNTKVHVLNHSWLEYWDTGEERVLDHDSFNFYHPKLHVIDSSYDGAHDVAIADIDGDGKLDIVADAYVNHSVKWYKQPANLYDAWTGYVIDWDLRNAHDVQVGDINNDSRMDIIALSLSNRSGDYDEGNGTLFWYQAPADPTVVGDWVRVEIETGNQTWTSNGILGSRSLSVFDVDSDGDLDVILAVDANTYRTRGALDWYENINTTYANFTSNWTQHRISSDISNLADAQAGDLDGDGNPDIVTAEHHPENAGTTEIWFAPDDPTQTGDWQRFNLSLNTSWHVDITDFDVDGNLDILVAHWKHDKISWYKNPGGSDARTMSNWIEYVIDRDKTHLEDSMSIIAYDMDNDSDLDIVVNSVQGGVNGDGWYFWYERPDDPTDTSSYILRMTDNNTARAGWAHDLKVNDIDGDGSGDIVGSAATADTVAIYYNGTNQIDRPFSLSVWVNNTANAQGIMARWSDSAQWGFYFSSGGPVAWSMTDGTNSIGRYSPTPDFNVWVHLVGTYDGSAFEIGHMVYQDGSRTDDSDISVGTYVRMLNRTGNLTIGSLGLGGGSYEMNGHLDEVRIYDRVLTSSEVLEIYNCGRQRNMTCVNSSLVMHLPMNEQNGSIIYDHSPYGNNVTRTGGTWTNDSIIVELTRDTDYTTDQYGNFILLNTDIYDPEQWNMTLIYENDITETTNSNSVLLNNTNATNTYTVYLYNITDALIYYSNWSVTCISTGTCDDNINFTLGPGNYTYILNNFNVTYGSGRTLSPIWYSAEDVIESNLSTMVDVYLAMSDSRCDSIQDIQIVSDNSSTIRTYPKGSFTCQTDNSFLLYAKIESQTNTLIRTHESGGGGDDGGIIDDNETDSGDINITIETSMDITKTLYNFWSDAIEIEFQETVDMSFEVTGCSGISEYSCYENSSQLTIEKNIVLRNRPLFKDSGYVTAYGQDREENISILVHVINLDWYIPLEHATNSSSLKMLSPEFLYYNMNTGRVEGIKIWWIASLIVLIIAGTFIYLSIKEPLVRRNRRNNRKWQKLKEYIG